MDDLIEGIGQNKINFFSTMDLMAGFHQVPIEKSSQDKMGFVFPGGFYKWLYMPFGLKNAPSCFQHYMDKILRGIPKRKAECYIDDLLLKPEAFEQHIQNMCEVLDHLQKNNMMVNISKCDFLRESVCISAPVCQKEDCSLVSTRFMQCMTSQHPRL